MRWTWDEAKNQRNERKHGLDFETAQLVFDLVVYTWPLYDPDSDEEVGRIISARKATKGERRAYDEGNF